MTAAAERTAVGTIMSAWTATQVAWPNRDFTPPTKASWVRVSIQSGDGAQLEIGTTEGATHRHPGIVIVQVFSPTDWGDKTALDLADDVAALFRRQRISFTDGGVDRGSIVFRTPSIRAIGVDGGYFQVNVSIPFVRDHLF